MEFLEHWYDWLMAVVHKPLGDITLLEFAGVIGTAFACLVVTAFSIAVLSEILKTERKY